MPTGVGCAVGIHPLDGSRWLQMVLRTGRLSLKKMIGFRGWPRIGKSGPGGAQGLNVNNWPTRNMPQLSQKPGTPYQECKARNLKPGI